MIKRGSRWTDTVYWVLWITAIALYLAWPLTHLKANAWSNDEGLYVQRAALTNAGYPLYTETFINKPPLLIWMLQLAFRAAGQTLATARLTSLCLTLVGFLALGLVVGQLWGRWAGLVSAWVLLALPEVPVRAHAVMSDLPAMAFALLAMGAALSFRRSGRRIWMALTGAAFAGALLIHPLLIYMALPLAVILFLPGSRQTANGPGRRAGWLDLTVFVSIVAGMGLLVLVIIDWRAFLTWVGQYNIRGLDANVEFAGPGHLLAIEYLQENWPLVFLATVGTTVLGIRPHGHHGVAVTSAWFVATAATLAIWSPVWKHYMLFLALPLVAAASGGLATTGEWLVRRYRGKHRLTGRRAILAALAFVGAVVFVVYRCGESMPQPEGGPEWSPDQLAAQAFLETAAPPGGFVVTDDPLLAFVAGRLVPPRLTGASFKQIRLGYLTADDLVISTLRYKAQAVLFATGRLALVPSFERWIATIATEQHDFGPLRAYRLDLPPSIPHATGSHLDNAIALDGYSLSSEEVQPGSVLTVTLFWRPVRPVTEDYTVFVHLMDEANHMWDQHDGPPLMEAHSTSQWTEGMLLPDPHPIVIGPETPPGTYRLSVGMYRWPSLKRLPAFRPDGSRWRNDRLVLTELRLTAPKTGGQ